MEPTPAAPRVHLQSPQTAVPTRAVEPGRTRHIAVASPPLPAAALQRRTRVVLYYRVDGASASARLWEEAMWTKESLSEAVADHPEMAGRLRRHADGSWEVKLNDAGVRFTEATAEATLDEFLATVQDKDHRARSWDWEAALAPWSDVNAEDPDVSALVYVQESRIGACPRLGFAAPPPGVTGAISGRPPARSPAPSAPYNTRPTPRSAPALSSNYETDGATTGAAPIVAFFSHSQGRPGTPCSSTGSSSAGDEPTRISLAILSLWTCEV